MAELKIPREVELYLLDLIISHERIDPESSVRLPSGSRTVLQEWLERIVINPQLLHAHRMWLGQHLKQKYRFREDLAPEQIKEYVEWGVEPEQLSNDQLAELLLNPIALYSLHDALVDEYPEYWENIIRQESRKTVEDLGLTLPHFDTLTPDEYSAPQAYTLGEKPLERQTFTPRPGLTQPNYELPADDSRCEWRQGNPETVDGTANIWLTWNEENKSLDIRLGGFLQGDVSVKASTDWSRGVELGVINDRFVLETSITSRDGRKPQPHDRLVIDWNHQGKEQHVVITITFSSTDLIPDLA
ncbi:hypothetical protein [Gimesia maris]|uniref:Uncharacterized protein n=1 Tax=Gimesia maris TaxID=122 RepID=A0ABX5YIP1_9PLAN|nr:hypothetical protein [Gimesia maris]EDL57294.1 hypothetical protein PM8797T_16780 [Gimesia maris DSM 8797]QEG15579.1 hypothetical protein GmarT_14200 [Gimesia maris]QGQ31128.1 hypothetical protein F1729_22210 [Gimesia maris]